MKIGFDSCEKSQRIFKIHLLSHKPRVRFDKQTQSFCPCLCLCPCPCICICLRLGLSVSAPVLVPLCLSRSLSLCPCSRLYSCLGLCLCPSPCLCLSLGLFVSAPISVFLSPILFLSVFSSVSLWEVYHENRQTGLLPDFLNESDIASQNHTKSNLSHGRIAVRSALRFWVYTWWVIFRYHNFLQLGYKFWLPNTWNTPDFLGIGSFDTSILNFEIWNLLHPLSRSDVFNFSP